LVDNFDDTPQNRNNIAFQAAGTFWRILIVYTVFYVSKLGNEKLAEIPTQPWPGAKEKAEVIFEQLEFLLRTAGETYPNWSDDILFNGPYLLWHSLTQLYGFTFTEGELVDSISLPL
jgi:hypothetical protein